MLEQKKIRKTLYYILGFFATLFCLKILGISIVFFPYFLINLVGMLKLLKCFKMKIFSKKVLFYYLCIMISLFIGNYYGIENFKSNLLTMEFFKIISFIILLVFIKIEDYEIKKFYEGLKLGIVFNLIWATLELVLWNINKIPLNDIIFRRILGYNIGHTWVNTKVIFNQEVIRVCGFSWDPSFLGMLSALGVIVFKNKYLKMYSFFILLNTHSRSGQVALIFTLLSIKIIKNLREINYKKIFQIIIVLVLGLNFIFYFINTTKDSHIGDKRRVQYYFSAISSTYINKNVFLFLWGGSPFKTGNIFYLNENLKEKTLLSENMTIGWKIESDWAGILAGRGWMNFFYYVYLHMYILYFSRSDIKKITMIFFFAGIGYTYENSIIINIIIVYFYNNLERKEKNERNNISWRKWNKALSNNKGNIKTNKSNI